MLLIKNGYIKPMVGEDIENGCVLIGDDGKIVSVGKDISVDGNVSVIDAGGRLVTPGCVEAHCHIGVHNSAMRWEGADYNETSDPITPQMRAIDGINPMDEAFDLAIKNGVTTACTGPGSANVVGGTFVAIKLVGKRIDNMIVKDPAAMKCAFGENPKGVYGQNSRKAPVTRMATAAMLRELLFKAKNYYEAKQNGKDPSFDMKLEAMIPVIKKEIPLKAHAHRADDIFTAIRIAKEFDVLLTLDHCTDGELIADELAMEGYPAFIGPSFGSKTKIELNHKDFKTSSALYKAGVPISIITDAPVIPLQYLPMCAGFASDAGLPYEEAWKAITINPATQIGIGDRVGSLEAGKDGDAVIWQADPLKTVGASAYITVVDGKVVYSEE
ncbi:MAG: amidohydrolase [Ruminococcaceae bacterium]|nr:amidohydrolase [Oscillospiraceae bacterium]